MVKKIFFTPGPSELYPTVSKHVVSALDNKIGTISHRSKQFQEIYAHAVSGLRTFLSIPDNYQILFLASATEIWERAIQNCVEHTSCHFVNGSFSKRFYEFAGELGRKGIKIESPFGQGFYPEKVEIPSESEIICLTQNETSSGVQMPVEDINKIREKNKEALIFVDAVSSLPHPKFDFSKIDSTYFSVQKCFGLPAGLGIWLINERVIAKAEALQKKGLSIGTYHTIPSLLSKAKANQTPETPNVLNIYLLGKVLEDFNTKGTEAMRKETDQKSKLIYNFLENSSVFTPAVKEVSHRSATTIVANTKIPSPEVNKKLEPFEMTVGTGYGSYKEQQIRIANFPAHSPEQVEKLISTFQKVIG